MLTPKLIIQIFGKTSFDFKKNAIFDINSFSFSTFYNHLYKTPSFYSTLHYRITPHPIFIPEFPEGCVIKSSGIA